LQHAEQDQDWQTPGDPTQKRGQREQQNRQCEGAYYTKTLHQPARQGHRDTVGNCERSDYPGALIGRDAKIAGDGRDRHIGDGGVEHLHEGTQGER
jgi:hypothetical protein